MEEALTKEKIKNTLEFYRQPFYKCKFSGHVWDVDDQMVFQFEPEFNEKGELVEEWVGLEDKVVSSLNGMIKKPIPELKLTVSNIDPTVILNNGKEFITIRGWGNLTGIGGHNLSNKEAISIQNNFRDWIIYRLSN